ncbi:MAG: phage holin family protein [Armatimonadota bacterium]|nr:MAG: phage holin family protein [Armatimonadota bacterium]
MRALFLRWILMSLAVWGAASLLPNDMISVSTVWTAFLAVAIIGLLNALVKPILFLLRIVTFPINFLTLGLFALAMSFVMNAIVFWAVGQWLPGFHVHGVVAAAAGAAIMGAVNGMLILLIPEPRRGR